MKYCYNLEDMTVCHPTIQCLSNILLELLS